MRGVLRAVVSFGLLTASVVACTVIVDGQTKNLSDTCTPRGAGDTQCGACAVSHCQSKINAICTGKYSGELSNLEECIQSPYSYGSSGNGWNCSSLIGDAALNEKGLDPTKDALRACVADNCMTQCTTCTSIDAGSSACGKCIMDRVNGCGALLDTNDGCCTNGTVIQGIGECTAITHARCDTFLQYSDGGGLDASVLCNPAKFGQCVLTKCTMCPTQ